MRPDACDPRHDAHRLLEGTRDAKDYLSGAERRALGDDRDAREVQLGVDRGGEPQRHPHARGAEQRNEEIHEPLLPAQDVEELHRRAPPIRALSCTPYAPVVTTVSPAATPERISTSDSVRPPIVTARASAMPAESTTKTR